MIAAEAHTPLERVRRKLEETFGEFDVEDRPERQAVTDEEQLIATLSRASTEHRLVEIEYTAVGEETSVRVIEPHALERELPWWYIHSWDRTRDAQRSFRLDRMKRADLLDETFEPRPELVPKKLSDASTARVLSSPVLGRWRVERGALPLAKGYALEELRFGSMEWIVGEILAHRGEAEVIEPAGVRNEILTRAKRLKRELGRRATAAKARR
jgi:predicted DNA-binding transcriptional regulator YafY